MKTQIQIPLYKANLLGINESIIGYYEYVKFSNKHIIHSSIDKYNEAYEINPSTLEMSFDGEKFYDIDAIRLLIKTAESTPSSKAYEILGTKAMGVRQ